MILVFFSSSKLNCNSVREKFIEFPQSQTFFLSLKINLSVDIILSHSERERERKREIESVYLKEIKEKSRVCVRDRKKESQR